MRLLFVFFLLGPASLFAQHLRHLDFSGLYASNGIQTMQEAGHTCERGLPQDTCVTVVLEFDTQGRLIVATDYFACGKVFCIQEFEYDADGMLTKSFVKHRSRGMKAIAFKHVYDAQGRLIERHLEAALPNFWQVETLTLRSDGSVASMQQKRQGLTGLETTWESTYLAPQVELAARSENTQTNIFDLNGLQLLHHRIQNLTVVHITSYTYTRF